MTSDGKFFYLLCKVLTDEIQCSLSNKKVWWSVAVLARHIWGARPHVERGSASL